MTVFEADSTTLAMVMKMLCEQCGYWTSKIFDLIRYMQFAFMSKEVIKLKRNYPNSQNALNQTLFIIPKLLNMNIIIAYTGAIVSMLTFDNVTRS